MMRGKVLWVSRRSRRWVFMRGYTVKQREMSIRRRCRISKTSVIISRTLSNRNSKRVNSNNYYHTSNWRKHILIQVFQLELRSTWSYRVSSSSCSSNSAMSSILVSRQTRQATKNLDWLTTLWWVVSLSSHHKIIRKEGIRRWLCLRFNKK